jgi:hypothetical protein
MLASKNPFERRTQPIGFDVGEVTKCSEIHTQHRNLVPSDERDSPKHRAIASEADSKVEALDKFGIGDAEIRATKKRCIFDREHHTVPVVHEPSNGVERD